MNNLIISLVLSIFFFSSSCASLNSSYTHEEYIYNPLSLNPQSFKAISSVIYTPNNSSYLLILNSLIKNLRFTTTNTPKPLFIVIPQHESHIRESIMFSKENGIEMRIRSGGHDYEGISSTSESPFFILDMRNFNSIDINVEKSTASVQAGATLGELYHTIAMKSGTLAFPAGVCPTVCVGGHFGGGGYGMISRKHGLAIDHIIDARLIDANGRILDRESMGEDLFWAIRGGGSASFGVIIAWKIKLVSVPEKVTVFDIVKTIDHETTQLIEKWQYISDKIDENLLIRLFIRRSNSSKYGTEKVFRASFTTLFLGPVVTLLPLMQESFPELGLVKEDCTEMSWAQSTLYFARYPIGTSLDVLLNKTPLRRPFFKGKSDYVKEPISYKGLEGIWERIYEKGLLNSVELQFSPYGGKLNDYSEREIPFPHRSGNIYMIHYLVFWSEEELENSHKYMRIIRRTYNYMTHYVSSSPRTAYLNYRDLDLGVNRKTNCDKSYEESRIWGSIYFKNNFDRLVMVKTMVDPQNLFRHEQSIPLMPSKVIDQVEGLP